MYQYFLQAWHPSFLQTNSLKACGSTLFETWAKILFHCGFYVSSEMMADLGLEDVSLDESMNAESGQMAGATSYKPPDSARVSSLAVFLCCVIPILTEAGAV